MVGVSRNFSRPQLFCHPCQCSFDLDGKVGTRNPFGPLGEVNGVRTARVHLTGHRPFPFLTGRPISMCVYVAAG